MDEPATNKPEMAQTELDIEAQARAASAVGRVISDRYRVDDLLAMGGMGAVYRGTHLLLKKRIAIKILHPGIDNLPELVTRFQREAIAGAHVQHPNVAAATDFGTLEDGSYFLVLEYVKGRTLHRMIKDEGALAPARAASIARQIASALAKSHAIGIVHRDVKPRNIMVSEGPEEIAKLIDFGLAKVPVATFSAAADRLSRVSLGRDGAHSVRSGAHSVRSGSNGDRITLEGTIFGTIAYLAPEAALGMDAVDERSDLYALGIVLYEMLSGKHPFDATDASELFQQQRFTPPPPFSERVPGNSVPAALEAVAMRLLDKAPDLRYPSGEALVEALDAAVRASNEPLAPLEVIEISAPIRVPAALAVPAAITVPADVKIETRPSDGGAPATEPAGSTLRSPSVEKEPAPAREPASRSSLIGGGLLFFALGVALMLVVSRLQRPAPEHRDAAATTAAAPIALPTTDPLLAPPPLAPSLGPEASAAPIAIPDAVPEPSASASASASSAPVDTTVLRLSLIKSARTRDWGRAGEALVGLLDADPEVLRRPDIAVAARDVTAALDRESGAEKLFAALARGPGTDGLDVLYDIVQAKGGSHAALRAAEILRQDAVMARATPALRAAFRLRDASCVDKIPLFEPAGKEGDGRALTVLETQGHACFKKSKEVDAAIKTLKDRLNHGAPSR